MPYEDCEDANRKLDKMMETIQDTKVEFLKK